MPVNVVSDQLIAGAVVIVLVALALSGLFAIWYKNYLGIPVTRALLLSGAAVFGGIAFLWATRMHVLDRTPLQRSDIYNTLFRTEPPLESMPLFLVTFCLGFGFLTRLYRNWVLDLATPAERLPGSRGFRAALSPLNVITLILIVLGAYFSMGWSPWQTALGALGLLLAYPLCNTLLQADAAPRENPQEAAEERRRVLALVEAGKISADDGAELIGALGQSRAGEATRLDESAVLTGNRRLMLLGAALVLIGFCLPCLSINLGEQVNAMVSGMQQQLRNAAPEMPHDNWPAAVAQGPVPVPVETLVIQRGGDISYALGWIILAMGLAVAALPLLWPTRANNRRAQRSVSLVALAAGTVLLLYLVVGMIGVSAIHLEIGLWLILAGYVVLWMGAVREYLRNLLVHHSTVTVAST